MNLRKYAELIAILLKRSTPNQQHKLLTALLVISMATGCTHMREHKAIYIAGGIVVAVALANGGGATDPCADIPPYKGRHIQLCRSFK